MKKNKKNNQSAFWYELIAKKGEFQDILKILNRFYEQLPDEEPNPTRQFREKILNADPENLRIFFKKFGLYEFIVAAEIKEKEGIQSDSWIHIDGIAQERAELSKIGLTGHPIFSITCISDLFNSACKKAEDRQTADLV